MTGSKNPPADWSALEFADADMAFAHDQSALVATVSRHTDGVHVSIVSEIDEPGAVTDPVIETFEEPNVDAALESLASYGPDDELVVVATAPVDKDGVAAEALCLPRGVLDGLDHPDPSQLGRALLTHARGEEIDVDLVTEIGASVASTVVTSHIVPLLET